MKHLSIILIFIVMPIGLRAQGNFVVTNGGWASELDFERSRLRSVSSVQIGDSLTIWMNVRASSQEAMKWKSQHNQSTQSSYTIKFRIYRKIGLKVIYEGIVTPTIYSPNNPVDQGQFNPNETNLVLFHRVHMTRPGIWIAAPVFNNNEPLICELFSCEFAIRVE